MKKDGFLFVRTFSPRINIGYVDIIEDENFLVPDFKVMDVADFYDEID